MTDTQSFWHQHLCAIADQGVTTSSYARQHGLSLASLYYWQGRQRKANAGKASRQKAAHKFIALKVIPDDSLTPTTPTRCTLVLSGGWRLEMSALPDPQWLLAVAATNRIGAH